MLTASQCHEPVVRRTPGDAVGREFPVRSPRCSRRQNQYFIEVLIDERDRIRRRHARITRQPGEDRVRLRQGMTAQTQRPPPRPLGDRLMAFVRSHQQRHSDARVHRQAPTSHRRTESISAYIISSVTAASPRETRRPSASRSSRAVRPPGVTCTPVPYGEMSTVVPGVRPRASRRCLGSTTRPPESITASMGKCYQSDPISMSDAAPQGANDCCGRYFFGC